MSIGMDTISCYRFALIIVFLKGVCGADRDIYWRDYKGKIPHDAVPGGHGVFVGQVIYEGFLIPGSIYVNGKSLVSEYFGRFEVKKDIRILCSGSPSHFKWERIHTDNIPENLSARLVEGGFQNDVPWYVGRAFHENEWRIGKVGLTAPYFVGLLIWSDDESTHRVFDFEALTYV